MLVDVLELKILKKLFCPRSLINTVCPCQYRAKKLEEPFEEGTQGMCSIFLVTFIGTRIIKSVRQGHVFSCQKEKLINNLTTVWLLCGSVLTS